MGTNITQRRLSFARALAVSVLCGTVVTAVWAATPTSVGAGGFMQWIDPYCASGGGGSGPGFHWWGEPVNTQGAAYSELLLNNGSGEFLVQRNNGYAQYGSSGTINVGLYYVGGSGMYRSVIVYTHTYMPVLDYDETIACW